MTDSTTPTQSRPLTPDHTWSELTLTEQAYYYLPPGGRWFKNRGSQAPMLELYRQHGGITLGWDMQLPSGKVSKMFGIYTDIDRLELIKRIYNLPPTKRAGYELIPSNTKCRAHADIEWVGADDPQHAKLAQIVAHFRAKTFETFQVNPEIYVSCSTRVVLTEDKQSQAVNDSGELLYKHSYHLSIPTLVFQCNHDGEMKRFFTTDDVRFHWIEDGMRKSMIDLAIYTPNRQMRLPYCCKLGSTTGFTPMNADGFDTEFDPIRAFDPDTALLFFAANPALNGDNVYIRSPPPNTTPNSTKAKTTKRPRTGQPQDAQPQAAAPTRPFPVPISIVKELLELVGDTVTTLTNVTYLPEEETWKIQGDQRKQQRPCLVTPGTTHSSNNCLLFIDRFSGGFRVKLCCMATGCNSRPKPVLGYITFNTETLEWQMAPSPQFKPQAQPAPAADTDAMDTTDTQAETMDTEESMHGDEHPAPGPSDQRMEVAQPVVTITPIVDPPADQEDDSYEAVKERHERECFKILDPFEYVVLKPNGTGIMRHTHFTIQHLFNNKYFRGFNEKGEMTKQIFIKKWMADENIKVYKECVIDPECTRTDVLNLWRGYNASKLPPVDPSEVAELIRPIREHMKMVVTNGDEGHTDWIFDYLANIVQRPKRPTHVGILLYGTEGSGKGMIFEMMRTLVLGSHCTKQSSNVEHDLFGRFSNMAVNCVLAQLDEVQDLYKYWDRLKDMLTNSTVNMEMKNKDPIVLPNMMNLIFTTNNENVLKVSPNDRRFVLFRCTNAVLNDHRYKVEFGAYIERTDVARALYQHLLERDLSAYPYDFQLTRPITEYYKEAQMASICTVSRFFSALFNDNVNEEIQAKKLYDRYKNFVLAGGYKNLKTISSFGTDIKRIPGVTFKYSKTGTMYSFNLGKIRAHLLETNQFDPEATCN